MINLKMDFYKKGKTGVLSDNIYWPWIPQTVGIETNN